jgi:hypothetical protein
MLPLYFFSSKMQRCYLCIFSLQNAEMLPLYFFSSKCRDATLLKHLCQLFPKLTCESRIKLQKIQNPQKLSSQKTKEPHQPKNLTIQAFVKFDQALNSLRCIFIVAHINNNLSWSKKVNKRFHRSVKPLHKLRLKFGVSGEVEKRTAVIMIKSECIDVMLT